MAAGGLETTPEISSEVKKEAKDEKTGVVARLGMWDAMEKIDAVGEREESTDQRQIVYSSGAM